jgi:hypothetical protein
MFQLYYVHGTLPRQPIAAPPSAPVPRAAPVKESHRTPRPAGLGAKETKDIIGGCVFYCLQGSYWCNGSIFCRHCSQRNRRGSSVCRPYGPFHMEAVISCDLQWTARSRGCFVRWPIRNGSGHRQKPRRRISFLGTMETTCIRVEWGRRVSTGRCDPPMQLLTLLYLRMKHCFAWVNAWNQDWRE